MIDGLRLLNEVHEAIDFVVRHRSAIGAAREMGKIGTGAGERMMAGRVTATEDAEVTF